MHTREDRVGQRLQHGLLTRGLELEDECVAREPVPPAQHESLHGFLRRHLEAGRRLCSEEPGQQTSVVGGEHAVDVRPETGPCLLDRHLDRGAVLVDVRQADLGCHPSDSSSQRQKAWPAGSRQTRTSSCGWWSASTAPHSCACAGRTLEVGDAGCRGASGSAACRARSARRARWKASSSSKADPEVVVRVPDHHPVGRRPAPPASRAAGRRSAPSALGSGALMLTVLRPDPVLHGHESTTGRGAVEALETGMAGWCHDCREARDRSARRPPAR